MQLADVNGPFPWKDFPFMYVLVPIKLLKCSSCGEVALRPDDPQSVDRSVEASIRTLAGGFISSIIGRERCSQINLAGRIGVTPEYLSGLKSGSRTPSFQTFNILKILSENPSAFKISDPIFELENIVAASDVKSYATTLKKLA